MYSRRIYLLTFFPSKCCCFLSFFKYFLSLLAASKELAQTSYFMATNSLHLTTMCLRLEIVLQPNSPCPTVLYSKFHFTTHLEVHLLTNQSPPLTAAIPLGHLLQISADNCSLCVYPPIKNWPFVTDIRRQL